MEAQMLLTLRSLFVTEMLPLYCTEVENEEQIVKGECVTSFFHTLGDHLWYKLDKDRLSRTWSNLVSSYKVSEGLNWLSLKAEAWEETKYLEFQNKSSVLSLMNFKSKHKHNLNFLIRQERVFLTGLFEYLV